MASFNLGRIKGDRGESGPMGPTGPKGDRGDKGNDGTDGSTPVFSVGETVTLPSHEEASVKINTDNPASPVLSFFIPRGKDGADASGDMSSSVYDTDGKREDIFKYTDNLFSSALKMGGGTLTGALRAGETALEEGSVRNICVRASLPENAANGDICILLPGNGAKNLNDCPEGTVMLIDEGGKEVEYILAAKNLHKDGTVTFVRKRLAPDMVAFDRSARGKYPLAEIDILLESIYKNRYGRRIRDNLVSVKLTEGCMRECFLLSFQEYDATKCFSSAASRIAYRDDTNVAAQYLTRGIGERSVYAIEKTGGLTTMSPTMEAYYRPAFTLKGDMVVANTTYNGSAAVKLPDPKSAIYLYCDGEWKECS